MSNNDFENEDSKKNKELTSSLDLNTVIDEVFNLLNKERVTLDEAMLISTEITYSVLQKLVKKYNVTIEVATAIYETASSHRCTLDKAYKSIQELSNKKEKRSFDMKKGHGWIGDPNLLNENN